MKTKTIVLVEIAIVLCSVFLVALPAIAADQNLEMQKASTTEVTAASEIYEPGPLDVFGNANEDDTIDMRDTTYIKLAIFGKKPKTDLADANHDGKVSMLDVGQTKLIILGKEKKLTLIDSAEKIVTVDLPIKTIIAMSPPPALALKALGQEDKVIAVGSSVKEDIASLFPELSELPSAGESWGGTDWEVVLELKPDVFIHNSLRCKGQCEEKLGPAGITVLRFNFYEHPIHTIHTWQKFGYLFDEKGKGREFIDWYTGHLDTIVDRVEGLSEEDKPRVYYEAWEDYRIFLEQGRSVRGYIPALAGGINIAADLPAGSSAEVEVDTEWVVTKNPEYIFRNIGSGYDVDDPSAMKALRESIMNRPGLAHVDAVEAGRVYPLSWHISCSPIFVIGIAYMAKVLHPDLFEDLDPEAIHQEFLTRFMRLDYDLDEHGTFFYPPIECGDNLLGIPDKYKEQL